MTGEVISKPKVSVSAPSAKSSVFEKWAAMDRDSQRPLAKRQLSDESKARTTRATKKTAVREEEQMREEVKSIPTHFTGPQDSRDSLTTLTRPSSRRKPQKELICDRDFCRVDTHAIKAGKEVREGRRKKREHDRVTGGFRKRG